MNKQAILLIFNSFFIFSTHIQGMQAGISRGDLKKLDEAHYNLTVHQQKKDFDESLIPFLTKECPEQFRNYFDLPREKFIRRFPQKVLLHGAPGVGKSTIARAVAVKLGLKYQFIKCSVIADEYKNSGAKNMERLLTSLIKEKKTHVLIFDELEVISKKHENKNDTDNNMATAFWQLLDDLLNTSHKVIATTNNIKEFPQALKNRFTRGTFEIPLPSQKARTLIIKNYLQAKKYSYKKNVMSRVMPATEGLSGRDLEYLIEDIMDYTTHRCHVKNESEEVITKSDVWKGVAAFKYKKKSSEKDPERFFSKANLPHIFQAIQIGISLYSLRQQRNIAEDNLYYTKENYSLNKDSQKKSARNLELAELASRRQHPGAQMGHGIFMHVAAAVIFRIGLWAFGLPIPA